MRKIFGFLLLLLLSCSTETHATLPATGVYEIRADASSGNCGSNVCAGGFNSARGGVDYSTQTSAQVTNTDLSSVTTSTTVTSSGSTFPSDVAGNYMHITTTGGGAQCVVGWYEIVSRTDANNVVLDRAPSAGTGCATTTFYVGGAMSLNSTLDDELFETGVAGNIFYLRKAGGTLAAGENISIAAAGGSQNPIKIIGYDTTRTVVPTGTDRPTITIGTTATTLGNNWEIYNVILNGTNSGGVLSLGASDKVLNVKVYQSGTTANSPAIVAGSNALIQNSEIISLRGYGINYTGSGVTKIFGNYIHDSVIGIRNTGNATHMIVNNIIMNCATNCILDTNTGLSVLPVYERNTLYNGDGTTKLGTGISFATGTTNVHIMNNILAGFVTALNHADAAGANIAYSDYNNFYNNTTNRNNLPTGAGDIALDPQFTDVVQRAGSGATTTSGNHLVAAAGATFQTWGVTPGRDYLYIVSGTGPTNTVYYGILTVDSETQITTDVALTANGTADKVWTLVTGRNFAVGTNMKATGWPGGFPGALTTGYFDIGGVQRQESSGSGVVFSGIIGGGR